MFTYIFDLILFIVRIVYFDVLFTDPGSRGLDSEECYVVLVLKGQGNNIMKIVMIQRFKHDIPIFLFFSKS